MKTAYLILIGSVVAACIYLPLTKSLAVKKLLHKIPPNPVTKTCREVAPMVLVIGIAFLCAFIPDGQAGIVGNGIFVCTIIFIEVFVGLWTQEEKTPS